MTKQPRSILVLCTGNSCRSQIAHGYLEKFGGDLLRVKSAGIEIHGVNPKAIQVMQEDGVDISSHTSNNVTEYKHEQFDYVLTVCDHARDVCPYIPARILNLHQAFEDPAKATGTDDEIMNKFRQVRDQIKSYSSEMVNHIKQGKQPI